jgi:hypothetical protein
MLVSPKLKTAGEWIFVKDASQGYFWLPLYEIGGFRTVVIMPITKSGTRFHNKRLNSLKSMALHKITELYTQWFSVCPKIASKYRIIAMNRLQEILYYSPELFFINVQFSISAVQTIYLEPK